MHMKTVFLFLILLIVFLAGCDVLDSAGLKGWDDPIITCEMVADINPNGDSLDGSYLEFFTEFNGRLFFNAKDNDNAAPELHSYSETVGTGKVLDSLDGQSINQPRFLTVFDDKLYFYGIGTSSGSQLWYYDYAVHKFYELRINSSIGCSPQNLTKYSGRLFFSALGDASHGRELWWYDGNDFFEKEINASNAGSNPEYLTVYNGRLYFSADAGDGNGEELWWYDSNGDSGIIDINSISSLGSDPEFLTVYDGRLFFSAFDGNQTELFYYDSNAGAGNKLNLVDVNRGSSSSSNPACLAVYKDKLYFNAFNSEPGRELVVYDGSTLEWIDINKDYGSDPKYLTVYMDKLYFSASDDGTNETRELWSFDEENINKIDIVPGQYGCEPRTLFVCAGTLYFSADAKDGTGRELWMYRIDLLD